MSKAKPLIIIVVAIALAAGAAVYLSRGSSDAAKAKDNLTPAPGGGRAQGTANAPVTLVEYADYECPMCKLVYPMVNELVKRYPEKVRFEYHYFPLIQIHPHAMEAALAAEAAGDQGKYWEMHDLLFDRQEQWHATQNVESLFVTYAAQLGLNTKQFADSMHSRDAQTRILQDVERARNAQVQGTPTFFMNNQRLEPLPKNVDDLVRAVDDRLRAAK
jgi:protein-disulfide isomerase